MRSGIVTVVIPIYKVEKYLNRCIESIVNQTYQHLEIIMVDDGSPDNCPQICNDWAKRDSRVKVIHKNNAGLGMARNAGIENASGEYICFVDSDDYIELSTIERAYVEAENYSADIVCYGYQTLLKDGTINHKYIPTPPKLKFEGNEIRDTFLPHLISNEYEDWHICMSACMALFSMQLIKTANWKFVSEREIISEDVYSLLKVYKYVQRVVVIPDVFYNYYDNINSLTRACRTDRYREIRKFYFESLVVCDKARYGDAIRRAMATPYILFTVAAMKQISSSNINWKQKYCSIRNILEDDTFVIALNSHRCNNDSWKLKLLFVFMKARMSFTVMVMCWTREYIEKCRSLV